MKRNSKKLTGVLRHNKSAEHYHLRRYLPCAPLNTFIEQFWLVSWDLRGKPSHAQKNLPDANFHLVIDNQKIKLIGPVSKVYTYKMAAAGEVFGVKFELGALAGYLTTPLTNYVDKEVDLQQLADFDSNALISDLADTLSDKEIVEVLQKHISPLTVMPSAELLRIRKLVHLIKHNAKITKVEQLAEQADTSIRSIQRGFQYYLGLSPKWLIRKYRLHHALELLEQKEARILDIVAWLGYTDQSHLIRDFKEIIGETPNNYL